MFVFSILFITKPRKNENTKNYPEHFVLFEFRVFVIHFFVSSAA